MKKCVEKKETILRQVTEVVKLIIQRNELKLMEGLEKTDGRQNSNS